MRNLEYVFCVVMWIMLLIISILLFALCVALGDTGFWAFENFASVSLFAINLEAIIMMFSWGSTIVSLVILVRLSHPQEDVSETEDFNDLSKND
jgi:hypothetical protein